MDLTSEESLLNTWPGSVTTALNSLLRIWLSNITGKFASFDRTGNTASELHVCYDSQAYVIILEHVIVTTGIIRFYFEPCI